MNKLYLLQSPQYQHQPPSTDKINKPIRITESPINLGNVGGIPYKTTNEYEKEINYYNKIKYRQELDYLVNLKNKQKLNERNNANAVYQEISRQNNALKDSNYNAKMLSLKYYRDYSYDNLKQFNEKQMQKKTHNIDNTTVNKTNIDHVSSLEFGDESNIIKNSKQKHIEYCLKNGQLADQRKKNKIFERQLNSSSSMKEMEWILDQSKQQELDYKRNISERNNKIYTNYIKLNQFLGNDNANNYSNAKNDYDFNKIKNDEEKKSKTPFHQMGVLSNQMSNMGNVSNIGNQLGSQTGHINNIGNVGLNNDHTMNPKENMDNSQKQQLNCLLPSYYEFNRPVPSFRMASNSLGAANNDKISNNHSMNNIPNTGIIDYQQKLKNDYLGPSKILSNPISNPIEDYNSNIYLDNNYRKMILREQRDQRKNW